MNNSVPIAGLQSQANCFGSNALESYEKLFFFLAQNMNTFL